MADFLFMWSFRAIVAVASGTIALYAFRLTRWATRFEVTVKKSFEANDTAHDGLNDALNRLTKEVEKINGDVDEHGKTIAIVKAVCPQLKGLGDDQDRG